MGHSSYCHLEDLITSLPSDWNGWNEVELFSDSQANHSMDFALLTDDQSCSFMENEDCLTHKTPVSTHDSSITRSTSNSSWSEEGAKPSMTSPFYPDNREIDSFLFDNRALANSHLGLVPFGERYDQSKALNDSPAATAARRLLYVDRGTDAPIDLMEPTVRNEPSSSSAKMRLPRHNTTRPRPRKAAKRHGCTVKSCSQDFGRPSDLLRHMKDFHGLSTKHYECQSDYCLHRTRRHDKMKEHCRNMHGHAKGEEVFRTVHSPGSNVTSPGSSPSLPTLK